MFRTAWRDVEPPSVSLVLERSDVSLDESLLIRLESGIAPTHSNLFRILSIEATVTPGTVTTVHGGNPPNLFSTAATISPGTVFRYSSKSSASRSMDQALYNTL